MPEIGPQIWRLSDRKQGLGLYCSGDGLFLAGTPLLERQATGFTARHQGDLETVLSHGFGFSVSLDRVISGLNIVASALNAGDLCRARIAAVHLRIPDLPDAFTRLDMQLEDVALKIDRIARTTAGGDWNPDKHPRTGTAPNPGWFASTDGGSGEATLVSDKLGDDRRLRLPEGERNDEIGDLLEWIANCKPEDVPEIEQEIRRLFYTNGDLLGGAVMQRALTEAVHHPDQESREKILEGYEPITHRDPQLAGEISDEITSTALLRLPEVFPALRLALRSAGSAEVGEEAAEQASSEFWNLGWAKRGTVIHQAVGENLPPAFKTIDHFLDGVATSIKTMDLNAATYQNASNLTSAVNRYVDSVARFNGAKYGTVNIASSDITRRMLNVVVPKGSITALQQDAFAAAAKRASERGVILFITPF